jgi:spermidine synthase
VTTHEDPAVYGSAEVRRDHVASVVSTGTGMDRRLLVNGVGITNLTPLTKVMAHLPLVMRPQPPQSTLVICFGMGTTFRSLTTWGGRTTAVELVPSVRDAFGYYWSDAADVMARPGARVVIDDGRRFLKRTAERFDLITIDPPPPVEAAGSSLLYSVEFYRTVRARLAPGGLLAQWFPGGEAAIEQAVANSLFRAFPHVLVYRAFEGYGTHFLASEHAITPPTAAEAVARLPQAALRDTLEWHPEYQPQQIWEIVLGKRVAIESVLPADRRLAITDDRPFNEYFLLRRTLQHLRAMLDRTLPVPAKGAEDR